MIGALAAFMMLTPFSASAHDLPGPVRNLDAEGISQSEIKIDWDAPNIGGAVTSYRIDVSVDEFTWASLMMDTGDTMTEYTHDDLDAGDIRFYRVFALNSAGAGPSPVGDTADNDLYVSGTAMATAAPGQVRSLSARGVSHDQIDLSWSEPSMAGGGIDRYCIAVATERAFLVDTDTNTAVEVTATNCAFNTVTTDDVALGTLNTDLNRATDIAPGGGILIVSGKDTTYMHEGLNPELTLYYRAYATNSAGLSSTVTNVASAKTMKRPAPGTPSGLKPVSDGTGVDLYWNWPKGQLDIGTADFKIRIRSNTLNRWSAALDISVGTFPAQVDGHNPATVDGPDDDTTVGDYIDTTNSPTTTTSVDYQVRVELSDGTTGPWSKTASISWPLSTVADLPGLELPDNDPEGSGETAGSDLSATATLNSIKLSWEREGDTGETKPSGFVIDAIKGMGGTNTDEKFAFSGLQTNTSYTSETETHPRLSPGEDWYYRAFPYGSGKKLYGVPLYLQTKTLDAQPPDQLECGQVQAMGDGPTKIMLSWGMVSSDGGASVSGYLVRVSEDEDDNNVHVDNPTWTNAKDGLVGADMRTYTYAPTGDDMLEAENVRWFQVIVLNSVMTNGDGTDLANPEPDLSNVCAIKEATDAAGTPGMPDGLVVEPARDAGGIDPDNPIPDSERGVLLLWNKPTDPAGDAVTGYVIQRRTKDNSTAAWSDWEDDWAEIDASQTSHTDEEKVDMLDSGEARQYRVSAQSGAGTGASTPVVTYPHALAMHDVTTGGLGKPTMVAAVSNADGQATITWRSGMNADSHDVVLYSGGPDYNIVREAENVTGMSHTFTGVAEGRYAAVVISAMGDDMWDYSLVWVVVQ